MSFYSELSAIAGQENIEENVSFRKLTTFMAGGNARWFVSPASEETLRKLLSFLNEAHVPYFLLGRGANVLASDRGYEGVIVSLRKHFSDVVCDGPYLRAGAGALMADVSKAALDHGLTGLEFMSGIPGTVGGGLFMNAGAYGGEIRDVTVSVRILEKDGTVRTVANEEMGFSYRHSALSENGAVALEAVLKLKEGDPDAIRLRMQELNAQRKEKQPLEYASAGSTFKRPAGHYAGALIEEAGLKGFRIGNAGVSEKHAGFVVNYKDASANEIYGVIRHVQDEVLRHSGILLEREVRLLGEF